MPKAKDLIGQRFGKLVCVKKAQSRNNHTYWLCQCDCGNRKEIQTSHLTSGASTSCGCQGGINNLNKRYNLEERECLICKKKFIPNNYIRLYCYECSPQGLTTAEVIRSKKRALKHLLVEYRGGECEKCGYNKCEGALQFHHTDPTQKDFTLSQVNLNDTDFSIDKIKEEVNKCQLLCANCHFEEHYIKDNE